jgi:hypothetical protein
MCSKKISLPNIWVRYMPKGLSRAAFSGDLRCPWDGCHHQGFTYEGKYMADMLLYKCKKCKRLTAYNPGKRMAHPYINNLKSYNTEV